MTICDRVFPLLLLVGCVGSGSLDEPTPAPDDDDSTLAVALCEPVVSVVEPHVLEGGEVEMVLTCGSDSDRAEFVVSVVNAPGGGLDAANWTFSWTTNLSSADRYDLLFSVVPLGDPAGMPESVTGTVWVADAWGVPGNIPVDPIAYEEEWGVPVLHLGPAQPLSNEYVPASIVFQGHGLTGEIKKRGAASLGYPKNSYTLHMISDELDTGPLGLGSVDRLVLITSFDDASYVRQKLAYDTWQAMAEHQGASRLTPRTEFVVVYLDGAFWGLFTVADHVDDDFLREMGLGEAGNLYKAISHDANFRRTDANGWEKPNLHLGFRKKEGELDVWTDLDDLVAWVADSTQQSFAEQWSAHLDIEEFIDWFLFAHWAMLEDSAGKNAYLYNDPASGIFRYVPWDMNHSWGQGWYPFPVSWDGEPDYEWNNEVFARIDNYPALAALREERRQDLQDDGPFRASWVEETLDGYYDRIEDVAARDWARWGGDYRAYWGLGIQSWEEDRDTVYSWAGQRSVWEHQVHP